ncbi:MAG: hypothetical protein D6737_11885 [Chloroflexi bacterium]|nr:MAG: hypothetical protein D6737_11885 [Chloroflexota bacterium]
MEETNFIVNDIHCDNCVRNIKRGLKKVPGVEAVAVDAETKRVRVTFDNSQTDTQALRAQLAHIGFPASDTAALNSAASTSQTIKISLAVLALVVATFAIFLMFPRYEWHIPSNASIFVVAGVAGVASFFAPCSFPLLVTFMTHEVSDTVDDSRSLRRGLQFAAPLALGMTAFLLLVGGILALGGEALFASVTFSSPTGRLLRGLAGMLLLLLGLMQLERLPFHFYGVENLASPLLNMQQKYGRQRPFVGFVLMGFAYPLAGFG